MSLEREHVRAVATGQENWGQHGSATEHRRYITPGRPTVRRRCSCGCGQRASHFGWANGCVLTIGCELSMHRWASAGWTPTGGKQ